jgi:protein-histidine pros-kinase
MRLVTKFNLVVVGVFLAGLAITAYLSWNIVQANARKETVERAGLMLEAALATRTYTIEEVAPLLRPHMTDKFYPQTVPAYAATEAFNKLHKTHGEYSYKEATLNPTNPRDRAADWETDIIRVFRDQLDLKEFIGVRDTPTGPSLYLARPIRITNPACLTCHSTPAAAPKAMLAAYGDANGFGWKLNEVVGAQIVSVPMAVPTAHAQRAFVTFMATLVGVFVLIILALNLMLWRIVIKPITRMAGVADQVSKGTANVPEFDDSGKDEMATLARSFTRMRRSMEKAMAMLRRAAPATVKAKPTTRG